MKFANARPLDQSQKNLLCKTGWLATRNSDFQVGLLDLGVAANFAPGYHLHKSDHTPTYLHCFVSGQFAIRLLGPENSDITFPSTAGERWYAFAEVICGVPTAGSSFIEVPSVLCRVSRRKLLEFLGSDPKHV